MRQLTTERQNDAFPSFSPDGSKIVFARNQIATGGLKAPTWGGYCSLYTMNIDGTQPRQVTPVYDRDVVHPQFTPDGRALIYTLQGELYRVALSPTGSASAPRKLHPRSDVTYASVSWSGKHIVASTQDSSVRVLHLDGRLSSTISWRTLASIAPIQSVEQPVMTPDGQHLIFIASAPESERGEARNYKILWQMDTRGRNLKRLVAKALSSDPW